MTIVRRPMETRAPQMSGARWRLVCSRDEQRSRRPALPPAVGSIGRRRVVSPIDPEGPGTWIAATNSGLAFALLNGHAAPITSCLVSRGRIIPLLAGAGGLDDVLRHLRRLEPLHTRAFSLLVASDEGVLEAESDGMSVQSCRVTAPARRMRTSSSVDGEAVAAWRARAFADVSHDFDGQDAFHGMADPTSPARGVRMARPDACTVSITAIEMSGSHVRMAYAPVSPAAPSTVTEIPRLG